MSSELIYGLHAVQSILKSAPQRVKQMLALRSRDDQRIQKVIAQAQKLSVPVRWQSRAELDALCDGNHQGIAVYALPGKTYDEHFLWQMLEGLDVAPFLLVLDGVTDPHNLGACLRSADAAGVHAVIVPKDNSVGLTETVRKVACGAADTVPLVPVTNLVRAIKRMQELGVWVVGAAGEAQLDMYHAPMTGPLAIALGAEGRGLRRLTREHCDHLAKIPMSGSVSSLNVSVATGVFLFEAVRQRGQSE